MVQHAMEHCEPDQLTMAFLLARQACLEGQHVFQSYTEWFHVSLQKLSPLIAGQKLQNFFVKC